MLRLMAPGCSNRKITAALSNTDHAATTYVGHILAKLALGTRAEAVAWAVRHGLA